MRTRNSRPVALSLALLPSLVAGTVLVAGDLLAHPPPVAATEELADGEEESMDAPRPGEPPAALLFIQGQIFPGAAEIYEQYLAGTRPLMAEYGAEVMAVGSGVVSESTSDAWPINAVLKFVDRKTAERFLADPRYLKLKERYRDRAYETLHLTLVESRAPRLRTAKDVAEDAFADFRQGLATGHWEPFFDHLSDDFTFRFPLGPYQGEHRGKDKAAEFFAYVSRAFSGGLTIEEVERVTAEENRVVFEFRDRGELRGQPYRNIVAISLDVCGERVCGYREYFGLVGPPPEAGKP